MSDSVVSIENGWLVFSDELIRISNILNITLCEDTIEFTLSVESSSESSSTKEFRSAKLAKQTFNYIRELLAGE